MSASITDGAHTNTSPPPKRKTADSMDCTDTCNSIREKLAKIMSAKKEGVQFKEDNKAMRGLVADISLAFSELKADNRDSQMENETKKIEV